ncbi:MAG: class I SAM-dependent methyltransferase [Blastocatellia bacterium]
MFAPITGALVEAARIADGNSVLDVAGGSGEPSITITGLVGASGSVLYTDAVAEMTFTARRRALLSKISNIHFCQCLAGSLPFSNNTFDAATCRLGVMLFDDPAGAIQEMVRVAKPGACVSFAVWSRREANPFFHVVADIVSRYIESGPDDPDAPGAFRFAERGKLAQLLREAGATNVTGMCLEFELEAPLTPRQFWSMRVELSDTLRSKVATLSEGQLAGIARDVEQAGHAFYGSGKMSFPAEVLIVTGKKP